MSDNLSAGDISPEPKEGVRVTMRDRLTKETATFDMPGVEWWEDQEFPDFWWSEGNAACDCNRSGFMYGYTGDRDVPEPLDGDGHAACLDRRFYPPGRFVVLSIEWRGKQVYSEKDPDV